VVAVTPGVVPGAARRPRVLMFPLRAPDRDVESSNGRGKGTSLFEGVTVLIVEDDFIVAFDLQTLLEEQGARVLGPAATLADARALLTREVPTIAVLDVNLNGDFVFPLTKDLRARHIPFVFATAYADDDRLFPSEDRSVPRLSKPVLPNVLVAQLKRLLR
jgi:two-component system, response regulator PdtaR